MTRKYNITTLKFSTAYACVYKNIQHLGGVLRKIQHLVLPRAVLASPRAVFSIHTGGNALTITYCTLHRRMKLPPCTVFPHIVLISCITVLFESYSAVMWLANRANTVHLDKYSTVMQCRCVRKVTKTIPLEQHD